MLETCASMTFLIFSGKWNGARFTLQK